VHINYRSTRIGCPIDLHRLYNQLGKVIITIIIGGSGTAAGCGDDQRRHAIIAVERLMKSATA